MAIKIKTIVTLALLGRQLKRKMIIVVEKFSELEMLIPLAKQLGVEPMIGLRSKMMVRSSGKWAGSSGDRAKFGLRIAEILNAIERLREEDMLHCAKLLHFPSAVSSRIFAKLKTVI